MNLADNTTYGEKPADAIERCRNNVWEHCQINERAICCKLNE